jgi:hypothetical protein
VETFPTVIWVALTPGSADPVLDAAVGDLELLELHAVVSKTIAVTVTIALWCRNFMVSPVRSLWFG